MKKLLLILITLFASVIGYSQTTITDNNITYTITSSNTVEVDSYDVSVGGTDLNIPAMIPVASPTHTVTGIGNLAFLNDGLTSVVIPNTVTSINLGAFQNNSLTSIVIPDGVTSISNNAFAVNQLTSVIIPNNVTSIGNNAFLNNNQLVSVTIPEGVLTIGEGAFLNNQLSSVILPSTLTSIGIGAFVNNPLTEVTTLATTPPTMSNAAQGTFTNRHTIDLFIPFATSSIYASSTWTGFQSVTELGGLVVGDTFIESFITYEVTSIAPNNVEAIAYDVAGGNTVNIPAMVLNNSFNVISVGVNAFRSKGLVNVDIPNSVTILRDNSFRQNSLTNVVIPNSVVQMNSYAFANNFLESVTISNALTSIELGAFEDNSLISVTIPDGVTSIGTGAFKTNALVNIVLPNSLLTISLQAFRANSLTSVTIPSNVTSIGNTVFNNNPLVTVTSENTVPPTITTGGFNDSFASNRSNIDLIIPIGTEGPYVTDTGALWINFKTVNGVVLSVTDFDLTNEIKVITTTDQIKIIASNNISLENYTMYSITGAKVINGTDRNINTSFLSDGVYIIKLNFDRGTVTKKIIIN